MNNLQLNVDLKKIEHNIDIFKSMKKTICAMVKANAYGVGFDIIPHYISMGVNFYGVSTFEEALKVRRYSKDIDIIVVSYVDPLYYDEAIENNITITLFEKSQINDIPVNLKLHIKFDTMMGRIGFDMSDISIVKKAIPKLNVQGIFTHFPEALNEELTIKQISIFKKIVVELEYEFNYIHCQNSTGSLMYDVDFCNMIRPGIGILGLFGSEGEVIESGLKPSLSLYAPVYMLKEYEGFVGYDLTQKVNGKMATIRIGYNDGLSRSYNGYRFKQNNAKIVGNISMCQTMITYEGKLGSTFEVFGDINSIYDLTKYSGQIVYQLLVSMNERTTRNYIE